MRLAPEEECGYPDEELAKEASNETERCGDLDLRTGFGDLNTYLGRPASAPLRPMTPARDIEGQNQKLNSTAQQSRALGSGESQWSPNSIHE
ncbi:hypothetical protein JHK87_014849 [Glycine soja]|nr:hypothetical protein JHK87_014849 [Glycine soja]